jgi:hypothetical protein
VGELRRGDLELVELVGEALPDRVVQRAEAQLGVRGVAVAAADQVAVVAVDDRAPRRARLNPPSGRPRART